MALGVAAAVGFAALVLSPPLAWTIAKILLAVTLLVCGLVCLRLIRRSREIQDEMRLAELYMDDARDGVVISAMLARAHLAELKRRLQRDPEEERAVIVSTILKQVAPVVQMVICREKNLFKLGMTGLKIAQALYRHFKDQK